MTDMEVEESLVTRRSKRSTAGNRMQAALAEMSIDDLAHDAKEDVDFVIKVDEQDAFESDFASTEEEEGADEEAGEKALEEEERMARRAARQKMMWKTPKLPKRVAFESPAQGHEDDTMTSSVKPKLKFHRRVLLGQIIDAETGEVMETPLGKRKSTRETTRINTQEVQSRMKDAESKRVSLTKRPKEVKRRKTQADLIAAALDLEEGNIKSHREYLAVEEERRKKARIVKPVTVGPKVRWRSRIEEVTVTVYDPAPPPVPPPPPAYPPPPSWSGTYPSTVPYNPYILSPFPNQPPPGPSPFPYASYNIPPPGSPPVSTPVVPATEAAAPSTPLPPALAPSTPAPTSKVPSSAMQDSTPTIPAGSPFPPPSTSVAQVPDPVSTRLSASSGPIPPPSMPPRIPSTVPPPVGPQTPQSSKTAVPSIPEVSTFSAIPSIPAPISTPAPAPTPGTANGAITFPPPPTMSGYPYHYAGYYPYPYYTPTPANRPGQQSQLLYPTYSPYYPYTPSPAPGQYSATRPHLQLQPPQQIPRKTTEKQTKNYAEVLLAEDRPKEKPSWRETMDALFGKHADWDSVRVYVGKNRPSSRQIQVCPITGLSARYRDPRSGVPYANLGAFRILSRLLAHEYVWGPTSVSGGVFVGHEKQRGAIGVPDSWADAMAGIPPKRPEQSPPPPPPPPPKPEEKIKKEKAKETQKPQKEVRVGERRSSRIAAETVVSSSIVPSPSTPKVDNSLQGADTSKVSD